jgi:tRNA (guanine37-N1)-methyltransferase
VNINFITLFPEIIKPYFEVSIIGRAIKNEILNISTINPRDFTTDKHRRVDLPLIGGGAGMLMMSQPIVDSLKSINSESHIIAVSPVGKRFNQKDAVRLSQKNNITIISGRYEGFDERIIEHYVDEVFSIGDYILSGGELSSLVIADAIIRNINGVLGNNKSIIGESFENNLLEAPNFAQPVDFENSKAVSIYLGGHHQKINDYKKSLSECKTNFFRPDLYQNYLIGARNAK